MANSPISKSGRVKVGVRCRPAFQDEIDFAKGEFLSIVETRSEALNNPSLGQLSLTLMSGKQREFLYDYVFESSATQDQVYNTIAKPVVSDVLKGFNGTIFAYGQTGTGKTYTMGILEFISNEHSGIIPRAVAQIFHYAERQQLQQPGNEITISLSFLQLYRETIQDLLAPANSSGPTNDDNLAIREDPQRGFYVEGLQEFVVRDFHESEALINLGLENRAIAPTLMNATSSRSHTVLTIYIEQRMSTEVQAQSQAQGGAGSNSISNASSRSNSSANLASSSSVRKGAQYTRTLRSKLLMVDLAGSERVRRTVSKGARLSEAKSINTSLSALGNVIAALAEANVGHIPYRDSKLTRLLQDSLGGTARTALIATVGPAAVNYGETLSTLLFATRCMSVKTMPVQHAEVDYAEMCAALQAKVNEMEGATTQRLLEQQEGFEQSLRDLRNQLELERSSAAQQQQAIASHSRDAAKAAFNSELRILLEQVERVRRLDTVTKGAPALDSWLSKPIGYSLSSQPRSMLQFVPVEAQQAQLLGYCFEVIAQLSAELSGTLQRNGEREELSKLNLSDEFSAQEKMEAQRLMEKARMEAEDPRNKGKAAGSNGGAEGKIGSHLAPMSRLDALRRVEGQYRSNNAPVTAGTGVDVATQQLLTQPISAPISVQTHPAIFNYRTVEEACAALTSMHSGILENLASVKALLARKDAHYQNVKEALTLQLVEKRKREEEVINWSYILKYLLSSSTKLRKQLRDKKTGVGAGNGASTAHGQHAAGQASAPRPVSAVEDVAYDELGSEFDESDFGGTGLDLNSVRSTAQKIYAQTAVTSAGSTTEQISAPARSSSELPLRDSRNGYTQQPQIQQSQQQQQQLHQMQLMQQPSLPQQPQPPARARGSSRGSAQEFPPPAPTQPPLSSSQRGARPPQQTYFDSAASDTGPASPPYSSLDDADYWSQTSTIQSQSTYRSQRNHSDLYSSMQQFTQPSAQQRSYQPAVTPASNLRDERDSRGMRSSQPAATRRDLQGDYATPQHDQPRPQLASSQSHRAPHSEFAQNVVQDLGVDTSQAAAAMSVIDKVAQITDAQLAQLDAATRNQILQIRSELGLSGSVPASAVSASGRHNESRPQQQPQRRGTPSNAPAQGIRNFQYYEQPAQGSPPHQRASSAPRQRTVSSGSASLLSQHALPPRSTPATTSTGYGASQSRGGYGAQGYSVPTSAARPAQLQSHYQDYPQRGTAPSVSSNRADYGHYTDEDDDNFSQLDLL